MTHFVLKAVAPQYVKTIISTTHFVEKALIGALCGDLQTDIAHIVQK